MNRALSVAGLYLMRSDGRERVKDFLDRVAEGLKVSDGLDG